MPSTGHLRFFLFVFSALCVAAFVVILISEFSDQRWAEMTVRLGQAMGRLIFTAVAVTFIIVEGGVMLAELYKKASRAEERAKWVEWDNRVKEWDSRRIAALRDNREFTEPRPASPAEE
jgi:hypothetical protein